MDLRQLSFAVLLADELHFGRAAERAHIAASVLSEQIRRLERDLAVQLFDRSTHHVRLTAPGEVFVAGARQVLADLESLRRRTQASAGQTGDVLRLGCVGYAQWWPPVRALLDGLAGALPGVRVETGYAPVPDLLAGLTGGAFDAVVVNGHFTDPGLAGVVVAEVGVHLLLPAGHRLTGPESVTVADLAGERLILWPRALNTVVYDDTQRILGKQGVDVDVVEASPVSQAWLGAVAAGEGVAFVAAVNPLTSQGVVRRRLTGPAPSLDVTLLWRRSDPPGCLAPMTRVARDVAARGWDG